MTFNQVNKGKKTSKSYIFRRKAKKNSNKQIFLEAILMVTIAIVSIKWLNSLPSKYDINEVVSQVRIEFSLGIINIFTSLVKAGALFFTSLYLIISVILLLGGLMRIFRLLTKYLKNNSKKTKNVFKK